VTRWLDETGGERGASYAQAFADLAASGADVHGEAAFVDALLPRGARVLDAGCGTGRVAVELARRGHDVVGVDSDPSMLVEARRAAPGLDWRLEDLAALGEEHASAYDLVVAAGNVVVFLAEGTEQEVVRRLAGALRPGGLLVSGWRTDRLSRREYDGWVAAAGLAQVARHATWDAEPWVDDAPWCVAVDRCVAVDQRVAVDRRVAVHP
jgi:SAM-dependent methyltransferase